MNLPLEKEKIKKDIDLIDDERIIKAIRKLLTDYDMDDGHVSVVSEPPITDEDMATPGGRTPTRSQIKDWLKAEDGEFLTGEEALAYSLKMLEEYKAQRKGK